MDIEEDKAPQVILHIGLHKTGTRFLQREVFDNLDERRFNYNPEWILSTLKQAMRHPNNSESVKYVFESVQKWQRSKDSRTLIISDPNISGDMYATHYNYRAKLQLLSRLFPKATVIYFVRRYSAWLQSAYKQHLVKGKSAPIEVFLNWYNGDFRPSLGRWVYGVRNLEALSLKLLDIYKSYAATYGKENVYLLRQEDLIARSQEVKARLAEALDIDELPEPEYRKRHNRSYSALAICLFHLGVHYSFPPPSNKDVYRRKDLIRPLKKFRRLFIQHVFDKLIYKDWDMLASHNMRKYIDEYYAQDEEEIENIADLILRYGPKSTHSYNQYAYK
jgi:hypothetical protein